MNDPLRVALVRPHLLAELLDDQAALLDALPDLLVRTDAHGACACVNRSWIEFTGAAPSPGLGRHGWLSAVHPEDHAACRATLDRAMQERTRFAMEYLLRRGNGEYGWISHEAIPLSGADDDFAGFFGVGHDITPQKEAELAARQREAAIRLLADNLPILIAYAEATEQRYTFANKAYARTYGWDEHSIIGHTIREVIGEQAYAVIAPYIDAVLSGKHVNYERPLKTPDGAERIIEVNLLPHVEDGGKLHGAFILINDVTKYRLAERAARESEERLRKFAAATNEGVVVHEQDHLVDCNEATLRMFGYEMSDVVGKHILEFLAPECWDAVMAAVRNHAEGTYEAVGIRRDRTRFPIEVTPREMLQGGRAYRMSVLRDLTERKRAEQRIQFMAHHDGLTGLPNRASLMERLAVILAAAQRRKTAVAVMFVDLDHFKNVNDSLGHHVGDTLLKTVAARLRDALREADTVARLGGDEFLVVLPDLQDIDQAGPVAEKLLLAVSEPMVIDGHQVAVSPSIGVSLFPRDGTTPDDLIRHADAAMYSAKEHGRANCQFFSPQLSRIASQALSLEAALREAVARRELRVHYQPQISIGSGAIVGIAALVRWQHPDKGLLMPDSFIDLAEQRGLIVSIGDWVLNEACRQNKAWQDAGLARLPVSVNMSAIQFKRRDLVADVARVLAATGLEGCYLELEVTESGLMEDVGAIRATLEGLRLLGVKVAIDDFGTGYSSLSYLKRFPIDKLKIDRSFVLDLASDADDLAITGAIIGMAKSLNIKVIAEGVETAEQYRLLADQHCDEVQGYLTSEPLPADRVALLLAGPEPARGTARS